MTKTGRRQQHWLVRSIHKALLRFTQARQSKPEPTSLYTMPAKGSSLGDISVLVLVSTRACMNLFCVHTFLFVLCVCMYVSVNTCLSK